MQCVVVIASPSRKVLPQLLQALFALIFNVRSASALSTTASEGRVVSEQDERYRIRHGSAIALGTARTEPEEGIANVSHQYMCMQVGIVCFTRPTEATRVRRRHAMDSSRPLNLLLGKE